MQVAKATIPDFTPFLQLPFMYMRMASQIGQLVIENNLKAGQLMRDTFATMQPQNSQ